ncbi:MAG: hypothetical protein AABY01_04540 [Nanoarchaeota archaeon]
MTDRPILFSGPMVRAILAGRKTVTRRVVRKPARATALSWGEAMAEAVRRGWRGAQKRGPEDGIEWRCSCPYGATGDRLWVREAHCPLDMPHSPWPDLPHRCGGDGQTAHYREGFDRTAPRWRPSIHMPRWASRLTLEIVSVRIERLQAITNQEARAEGVEPDDIALEDGGERGPDYRGPFRDLWDQINGERPGCSWAESPWVWRIEFRRLETA